MRQASIPRIIYGRLKRNYKEDVARAVRLDLAAGVGVEGVMRRKSGVQSEPSRFQASSAAPSSRRSSSGGSRRS